MKKRDFKNRSPLLIFISYFSNHKLLFAIDVLCACGIAAVDLMFPQITRAALYNWLPEQKYRTFFLVMVAVVGCYLLRSLLNFIVAYLGHTFGIRVEADIRRDLFNHIQTLSFGFYDKNRVGHLMSRMTAELFDITELAHHGPEDLFISAVTILGSLAVLFSIQWRLALVLALLIPAFLLVVLHCRNSMRDASAEVRRTTGVINADVESGLSGIRTAKAFANEGVEVRRFDAANDQFKTSKRQFHKAMGRFHSAMECFLSGLNVIIIVVGGLIIMHEDMC